TQCLPNARARNTETVRQVLFPQPAARRIELGDDTVAQLFDHGLHLAWRGSSGSLIDGRTHGLHMHRLDDNFDKIVANAGRSAGRVGKDTMKQQAIGVFVVAAIAMTPQARAADTQLLFLAEDVPTTLNYDGPSPTVNTSQTGWLNLLEPMFSYG